MALKKLLRTVEPVTSFHQRMREEYGHNYQEAMSIHVSITQSSAEFSLSVLVLSSLVSIIGGLLVSFGVVVIGQGIANDKLGLFMIGLSSIMLGLLLLPAMFYPHLFAEKD